MQSLANRHDDRAKRKAMNRTERGYVPGVSLGAVALAYRQFVELRARLGGDENLLNQLDEHISIIDADVGSGFRSLAEAPDGSGDTMAGIGVVNPLVVPAATLAKSEEGKGASVGNDAAFGETAPVTVAPLPEAEPVEGNINGEALKQQLGDNGGWGATTPTTRPEDANSGNGGGTDGGNS